ncbi:deoxyguanosinetriphosphate triphosphohydrolase, partial [bacterium]|nr:deoxyguanosinetriphosphate triphosphohydrolase [bacterium]
IVPTLEAQIIDSADEIAYINHDIDDGLEAGLISIDELKTVDLWNEIYAEIKNNYPDIPDKKIKYRAISTLIGYFIDDIVENTYKNIKEYSIDSISRVREINKIIVSFNEQTKVKKDNLKTFLFDNLYTHPKVQSMGKQSEKIVKTLFDTYNKNINLIPERFRMRVNKESKERVICDYIAGMTDRFAIQEFEKYT